MNNDLENKINGYAESAGLKLIGRLSIAAIIPVFSIFCWFAVVFYEDLKKDVSEIKTNVTVQSVASTEIKTILMKGLEPRVTLLEAEVLDMRREVRDRTAERFDKNDARELKTDLLQRLSSLQKQLDELRTNIK